MGALQKGGLLVWIVLLADFFVFSDHNVRVKRVIGGSAVSNHSENPWLISLQGKIARRSFFSISYTNAYCAGAIINERWIITAAHCFGTEKPVLSHWHARMASSKLKASFKDQIYNVFGNLFGVKRWKQLEYHPEKVVIHPRYNPKDNWRYDIALIKLKETVSFDGNHQVAPIDLPSFSSSGSSWPRSGQKCFLAGWGCTKKGRHIEQSVMKVDLAKINDRTCEKIWRVAGKSRLCAGYFNSGKGACKGDSGGPLVCYKGGKAVHAGVVSFVHSSYPESWPVMFSRTSYFVNWIKKTLAKN